MMRVRMCGGSDGVTAAANNTGQMSSPSQPRGHALSCGLLGFDSEGRGGAWYSSCSQPPAEIVYPVGRGRVSVRDVQTRLNERERGRSR